MTRSKDTSGSNDIILVVKKTCERRVSRLYKDDPRLGAAHLHIITMTMTITKVTKIKMTACDYDDSNDSCDEDYSHDNFT